MAVVVATPLGQAAVPDWATLNPLFDQPAPILGMLGIPWWFVISCGIILIIILVILSWVFKFRRMAPVKGYKEIQKKAGPDDTMVWLFEKTQKMIIECLKYADSIASYYNPTRISKWRLTSPMAMIHVGGYPAMMVSDDYDQSRDLVSEIALCHACEKFNADQEWLERNGGNPAPQITDFEDYRKYGRKKLMERNPQGISIPSYSIFNPTKFRKYFPTGRSAGFYGGVLLRRAKDLRSETAEKGWLEKHLPIMIIAAIIIIVNIAAWQVKFGPGA
jgi:hypothetical protein